MLTALRALLSSKKFITTLVGVAVAIAARVGFDLDPELVAAILGVFAMLVGAQGLADQGKEAAKVNLQPPSPTVESGTAAGVITTTLLIMMLVGCSGLGERAGRVAAGVVDCMTPAAKTAIGEFGPAMADVLRNATGNDGKVDWAPVRSVSKSLASPAARCVLASVVAEALRPKKEDPNAPKSEGLSLDPADLRSGFDAIRAEWGGPTFKLEGGAM